MKKLFLGCFLMLCCTTLSLGQEEAIKDSMEVFFKLDKSNLLDESTEAITAAFEKNKERILKVRVAGHTCDLGSDNYNMGLSEKRANSAFEYVKTLGDSYQEKTELFFYGEKEQKYDNRDENRRVFVLFYLEDDDRDTLIKNGCAEAFIEKGTYRPAKTSKSTFELKDFSNTKVLKSNNISVEDTEGRKLYFNSVVHFKATFGGAELAAKKAVKIKMPLVNEAKEGYTFYEGEEKDGNIVWKNTGKPCVLTAGADCKTYDFDWMNSGYCACAMQRECEDDCNTDAFSGVDRPDLTAANIRYSADKTVAEFEEGTYASLDGVTVVDDNNKEEDLDVCEQFEYSIATMDWFPNKHKMTDLKNIIVKSETSPASKTTRLYLKKDALKDVKEPVILVGDRHAKGYAKYADNVVSPTPCLGSVNCEYIVYDVPSTGVYKVGDWNSGAAKPEMEEKWIFKVRLLKESVVFVGNKKTGEVYKAKNAIRKDKTRPKEYIIYDCENVGDLVVYVQNSTKSNFKLYQEALISELKYKKAANMYVMRRLKFTKVQDFSEAVLTKCK